MAWSESEVGILGFPGFEVEGEPAAVKGPGMAGVMGKEVPGLDLEAGLVVAAGAMVLAGVTRPGVGIPETLVFLWEGSVSR